MHTIRGLPVCQILRSLPPCLRSMELKWMDDNYVSELRSFVCWCVVCSVLVRGMVVLRGDTALLVEVCRTPRRLMDG